MVMGTRYTRKQERAALAGQAAEGAQAAVTHLASEDFKREEPFQAAEPVPEEANPYKEIPLDPKDLDLTQGRWVVIEWHKKKEQGVKQVHTIGELTPHMIESGIIYAAWQTRGFEMNHIQGLYQLIADLNGQLEALRRELSDALARENERRPVAAVQGE